MTPFESITILLLIILIILGIVINREQTKKQWYMVWLKNTKTGVESTNVIYVYPEDILTQNSIIDIIYKEHDYHIRRLRFDNTITNICKL